jgi:cytochrome c-type biogenesis protein CcmH
MMTFWLICGVLIVIALAFVLPPLWRKESTPERESADSTDANLPIYRDQLAELDADLRNGIVSPEQYEQDRDEINRRVLDDVSSEGKRKTPKAVVEARGVAYAIAIALPVLAIGFYLKLGNLTARTPESASEPVESAAPSGPPGGMSEAQIEANVARLAKRLESDPNDLQGWKMLARSYSSMQKFDEASKAYEKAVALQPKDADLLSNYAFVLAMANGRNFSGKPTELIEQALKLAPDNTNTLGLAGGMAFEQKDYKKAIDYWTRALKQLPPGSDLAQAVNEKLAQAKSLAGENK